MKKFSLVIIFLSGTFICLCQQTHYQKKAIALQDSTLPIITISKEPRIVLNIHSGYSMGLGSTFKFYPDDIS